jgi:galactose mutarotase-like enzyme
VTCSPCPVLCPPHPLSLQIDGGGEPGYDHCYCKTGRDGKASGMAVIAELSDPASGRAMAVSTDLPGVQLYT